MALAAVIMMAASCETSRRALLLTILYASVPESARPTMNAAKSTRLNFARSPICHPFAGYARRSIRSWQHAPASAAVDQPCGLIRRDASRCFAADFMLIAADRGAGLGAK